MSPDSSVEEVLTRTLKRAGELAIPDDLHPAFPSADEGDGGSGSGESEPLARRSIRPAVRLAAAGIAAMIVVAVGLVVLLTTSPSTTIQRAQLSAPRGEQLLCGHQDCSVDDRPMAQANASLASPSFGPAQGRAPVTPRDTWIVASGGRFVRIIEGSPGSTTSPGPGVVYLSAGHGHSYRFATGRDDGPLSVVGHSTHSVTLSGTDRSLYVLNLRSSELVARG